MESAAKWKEEQERLLKDAYLDQRRKAALEAIKKQKKEIKEAEKALEKSKSVEHEDPHEDHPSPAE